MFLRMNDIKTIQLDHTSRCNLACPQCARTSDQGLYPINDLTVKTYEKIFAPFQTFKPEIFHCGNYGDVIASPTFDETFDWCIANGFNNIKIASHGSARKTDWWYRLGQHGIKVIFAIDGLSDTNHIYRKNSQFDKVIENAQAFIDGGGIAAWNFIMFEHNEHQLEQAKAMAKQMGFQRFAAKNTARSFDRTHLKPNTSNPNTQAISNIKHQHGDLTTYTKQTEIDCKFKRQQTFFIDMEARLWPCCWFGYMWNAADTSPEHADKQRIIDTFGSDFNRIDIHGWDILKRPFFKYWLEHTFGSDHLYTCGKMCGKELEASSGYGNNIKMDQL